MNKENTLNKTVSILTNNVHCERHVQYYSTIEKYFRINGWTVVDNYESDLVVFCACGFIDSMYERIEKALVVLKSEYFLEKNTVILGCLPKTHESDLKSKFKGHVIEYHKEDELDLLVKADVLFKEVENVHVFRRNFLAEPNRYNENFHIKISEGCLRKCTFCVINKVKGYIKSYPKEEILRQVKEAMKIDNPNIMLMGEDTFAYGIDVDTNIIELIREIKASEPKVNLSFGYLHIQWLVKYHEEIIALCKEGLINHLHIGLQHICNPVLLKMGRGTDFKEAYKVICAIKKEIPDFEFGADIMVGFPGETKENFEELIEFFKNDKCFVKIQHFGYSDVKGAPSSQYKDKVPALEIVERWEALNEVLGMRAYSNELNESKIDDITFSATRFEELFSCKDTFFEDVEKIKIVSNTVSKANNNILMQSNIDFNL